MEKNMKKTILIIFITLLAISSVMSSNKVLLRLKFIQTKEVWHLKGKVKQSEHPRPSTFEVFVDTVCEKVLRGGKKAQCKFQVTKFLFNNTPVPFPIKFMRFIMNNKGDILKRIANMPAEYRSRMQFPQYSVGPGDTWKNEIHIRFQPFIYTIKAKVKFIKYLKYKGKKCVLLTLNGSHDNLKYVNTRIMVKSKSTYIYDYVNGLFMTGKIENKFYRKVDNKWLLRTTINIALSPKR